MKKSQQAKMTSLSVVSEGLTNAGMTAMYKNL